VGTVVVRRPARRPQPEHPSGELVLEPPPELAGREGTGWQQMTMALPMLAGSVAMALMYTSYRAGPVMYVAGGLFGLSAIGMLGSQFMFAGGQSKRAMLASRAEYLRYLAQQRGRVRRTIQSQRTALDHRYPDPEALWSFADGPRLWERLPEDGDFARVRIGLGPQELATPIIPPQTKPLDQLEPMCAAALRRFITTYAVIDDLPVVMALDGFARVHLRGDPERCRDLVRSVLAHAATFHAPDDLLIAVCADVAHRPEWEWLKWLPHALHPTRTDALGQLRLISESVTGLEALLDDVVAHRPRFDPAGSSSSMRPHLVLVTDGGSVAGSDHLMTDGGVEGVTILDLSSPVPRTLDYGTLVLDVTADGVLVSETVATRSEMGRADRLGVEQARSLARQLAPLRLSHTVRTELTMTSETGLTDLLGLGDPYQLDTDVTWQSRPSRDRLRVPIGVSPDGTLVNLDLKESAQDGMGPHGLVIGATGSGKSELLRTLVLALATTHDSQTLNFVLVDFKGGATFTKLDRLPHTSAVITNLADELPLVDRMTDAINGELLRRQELLRAAGNYASQRDYERARLAGAPIPPLPSLLVVCDEFSELLSAKPDFIDMFVQIGRVGRSLGIHLLLASQRLEEGRLRGLDTHLSYRIGLRTFSTMESRIVLGVADAADLPRSPGHGYLKYGTEAMTRFRAAYVSGVHRQAGTQLDEATAETRILDYTSQYLAPALSDADPAAPASEDPDEGIGASLLDILVERLEGRGTPAHRVWLPPLDEPDSLDRLLPALVTDPVRGLTVGVPDLRGALVAVAGVVDRPLEQRRDLLTLDLSGAGGHAAVVGGPRSGRTTVLRNVVASLALTHTPAEVQCYVLDFGGGGFAALRDLPHVGGVAARLEPGQVRRTVAEVFTVLLEREKLFAELGVDSMEAYRRMRRAGSNQDLGQDLFGDVFLVVDGWATVRSDFEDLETVLADIAARGLSYGVHLLVGAARWTELRPAVRDMMTTRLELRLGDPTDSMLDRRTAINVPEQTPGRGITRDRYHFLAALPRIDGRSSTDDLGDGLADLVSQVARHWPGPAAPRVRLLPTVFPYHQLPLQDLRPGLPIGIAENDLGPVFLDIGTDPHALLYGDMESGKSAFLRAYARVVADRFAPDEALIVAVDYRRSLLGAIPESHLLKYGSTAQQAEQILAEVGQAMRARLPGPDVTTEQLRERNWWHGPQLFVLVDDYDLVAGSTGNPVASLLELLPQARDIGLHLVLARRTGGASRALYEPVTTALRDLGSPGVLLSGDREEGPLLGSIRPTRQPAGRGWLVTRRDGARLVQLAWLDPE